MNMNINIKRFDDASVDRFLIEFDPIHLKYGIDKTSAVYDKVYEQELIFQPTDYTKKDTVSFLENTSLVYGEDDINSARFLWRYKTTLQKILNSYVGIDGLSRLFDERYIEFEWDMHSRMDFNNHSISYYRDHFIHQLRDYYMVYELLDDPSIYEKVSDVLHDWTVSKISRYFHTSIIKLSCKVKDDKRLSDILKSLYDEGINAKTINSEQCNFDDYVENYYTRYIIHSSACIAALFHDIGYPIVHYFRYQKRLLKFAPSVYMLINGDKSSNEKIAALLSQSLLFQVVGKEQILYHNDEDHGAFSAIALLLHFYETGLIYSLPLEQKVAIEMAALAIYNHTKHYEFIKGEKHKDECAYYRAQFNLNPISYLLRLCDDAQEWERTYFEISNTDTLLYCSKCHTPLLRKIEFKKHNGYNGIYNENYYCQCGTTPTTCCFRHNDSEFDRRVIYNVTPSKSLIIRSNDRYNLIFDFQYDYFKLLRMCAIGPGYAKQRTKELNYLKSLVFGQNIGYRNGVLINFFMSNNPILIKSCIIRDFMNKIEYHVPNPKSPSIESFREFLNNRLETHYDAFSDDNQNTIWEMVNKGYTDLKMKFTSISDLPDEPWCKQQISFYFLVHLVGKWLSFIKDLNRICLEQLKQETDEIASCLYKIYCDHKGVESDLILHLLKDAIFQYGKMGNIEDKKYSASPLYADLMKSDDLLIFDVNCYCNVDNEINQPQKEQAFCPDYYSDLYVFECMNRYINDIDETTEKADIMGKKPGSKVSHEKSEEHTLLTTGPT